MKSLVHIYPGDTITFHDGLNIDNVWIDETVPEDSMNKVTEEISTAYYDNGRITLKMVKSGAKHKIYNGVDGYDPIDYFHLSPQIALRISEDLVTAASDAQDDCEVR